MEPQFWHQKWERNDIGFHLNEAHPMLVKFHKQLLKGEGERVFLPLCGKTLDIAWLLAQGYHIVGVELSRVAVEQLFKELGESPKIVNLGELELFQLDKIDIFVGDIFHLTPEQLGQIDAVYDRAALVALSSPLRQRYIEHLCSMTGDIPQLLISFDYEQELMAGPPFSVPHSQIDNFYSEHYSITLLESADVIGGLKGRISASEQVFLLVPY